MCLVCYILKVSNHSILADYMSLVGIKKVRTGESVPVSGVFATMPSFGTIVSSADILMRFALAQRNHAK
jgi:hypothetical protein